MDRSITKGSAYISFQLMCYPMSMLLIHSSSLRIYQYKLYIYIYIYILNSLRPSYAIWHQRTYSSLVHWYLSASLPGQNGRHFTDDIFKCIFRMKKHGYQLKFHWSLFLGVQLTIFQHWFGWWLGADQATSHYLNQCWPSRPTHICGTRIGSSNPPGILHQ